MYKGECSYAQGTVPQGLSCGQGLQQRELSGTSLRGVAWERLPLDFEFRNACLLAQNPLMKAYSLCIKGLDHPTPPTPFKAPEEQTVSCSPWEELGREC